MRRDVGVTETLRDVTPDSIVAVFEILTLLGEWQLLVAVLLVAMSVEVLHTLFRRTDGPLISPPLLRVVATVFGALALTLLLKGLFDLPRPPADLQVTTNTTSGFPSGHVLAGTVFWLAVARWVPVGRPFTRYTLATAVVAVVSLSRLVLGAHFLVDVLVSIGLAIGYVLLVTVVLDGRADPAFALAAVLATVSVLAIGDGRSVLALAGTLGVWIGWRVLELRPVRDRLYAIASRLRGR